jgi:hypothetical protein
VVKVFFYIIKIGREGYMENKILSKIKNKLSGFALILITSVLAISLMYLLAACTTEDASAAAIGTATAGFAGMMGIFICLYVLAFVAGIFLFVVWIIALVDCAKRENLEFPSPSENSKVLWILIIVLSGGVGAIIYYFLVMKKMPRKK